MQNVPPRMLETPEAQVLSPLVPMPMPLACKYQSLKCHKIVRFQKKVTVILYFVVHTVFLIASVVEQYAEASSGMVS